VAARPRGRRERRADTHAALHVVLRRARAHALARPARRAARVRVAEARRRRPPAPVAPLRLLLTRTCE
jgi:hypothetical protein